MNQGDGEPRDLVSALLSLKGEAGRLNDKL